MFCAHSTNFFRVNYHLLKLFFYVILFYYINKVISYFMYGLYISITTFVIQKCKMEFENIFNAGYSRLYSVV